MAMESTDGEMRRGKVNGMNKEISICYVPVKTPHNEVNILYYEGVLIKTNKPAKKK